jgi:hypothetical protein
MPATDKIIPNQLNIPSFSFNKKIEAKGVKRGIVAIITAAVVEVTY